jgi:hypothetical protein
VTIKGSEKFFLGDPTGDGNSGDGVVTDIGATAASTIHSSLTLIDASATTGGVGIWAGARNAAGGGNFDNGASAQVGVTYTGLTIKGGSGSDVIENDAKNGIVTDGNGNFDSVDLGAGGAHATLGTGTGDRVVVGISFLGTSEVGGNPGNAIGDIVKFGAPATADLVVGTGAETGDTARPASIGLTKVLNAAEGMMIDFTAITVSSTIVDETAAVASSTSLKAAENAALKAGEASPGVAYFTFHGNEYFIATPRNDIQVSSDNAIVELVGVTNIHHATNAFGLVTLA